MRIFVSLLRLCIHHPSTVHSAVGYGGAEMMGCRLYLRSVFGSTRIKQQSTTLLGALGKPSTSKSSSSYASRSFSSSSSVHSATGVGAGVTAGLLRRQNFRFGAPSLVGRFFTKKSRKSTSSRTISSSSSPNNNNDKIIWYPIPIGLGIAFLGIFQLYKVNRRERERRRRIEAGLIPGDPEWAPIDLPWYVHLYAMLPLRSMSRLWGYVNSVTLPVPLREPLYLTYSRAFGCNIEEALVQDLKSYPNLASFFFRQLKEGARSIDAASPLVSPADGKILSFGKVNEDGKIHQIKDLTYSLDALLGIQSQNAAKYQSSPPHVEDTSAVAATEEAAAVVVEERDNSTTTTAAAAASLKGRNLYHCVIYLAPGDYHRFHSPTDWTISQRRHFAGELLSVSPASFSLVNNLLVLNERVVLLGEWMHGFFSMIPVGATNVGSIKLHFDQDLKTNLPHRHISSPPGTYTESLLEKLPASKGAELGGFELGSTVVLVFEGPADGRKVVFNVEKGDKVQVGQSLIRFE